MTIGAAATAESSPLRRRQDAGIPAHASRRCPPQVGLPSRVNRLDVSEDGAYFQLIAPPDEPQLGQAVGVFPCLRAVLFIGRARAEEAAEGPVAAGARKTAADAEAH
jgi:hypothetical protein